MYSKTAKYLLTFVALVTIILPTIMDLNHTHMTNPLWAPHARFHWSIQWYSITVLNCVALYLIWGRYQEKGSRLATFIAALAPVLFWGAFFPSLLMPGTSPWPDGMEPLAKYPPNVFIAGICVGISAVGFWLEMHSRPKHALFADS